MNYFLVRSWQKYWLLSLWWDISTLSTNKLCPTQNELWWSHMMCYRGDSGPDSKWLSLCCLFLFYFWQLNLHYAASLCIQITVWITGRNLVVEVGTLVITDFSVIKVYVLLIGSLEIRLLLSVDLRFPQKKLHFLWFLECRVVLSQAFM